MRITLKNQLALAPVILFALALGRPARAQPAAKEWNVIVLLSATYTDMEAKLGWTGSSDDVNVLVLHDQDGAGLRAYRLLKDAGTGHPVGECCPDTEIDCCLSEALPLGPMGLSTSDFIYDPGVLHQFITWVNANYPARHALVSARGQMSGGYLLRHNDGGGMDVDTFAAAITPLKTGMGHKIDVVNFGFCLSADVDWAYALKDTADYLVASANYSHPPVAARWRAYMWVREVIKNPAITALDLALKIPEVYGTTTDDCVAAGDYCTNTNPPNPAPYDGNNEPWTASVMDLSRVGAVATATRELVCAMLADFSSAQADFDTALRQSTIYGLGYDVSYKRPDLKLFATKLEALSSDAAVKNAATAVIAAIEATVVDNHFQVDPAPTTGGGWFMGGNDCFGMSAFAATATDPLDHYETTFGSYQLASMWRLLLETNMGAPAPTVQSLAIEPATIELEVGASIPVSARGVSAEYGNMCTLAVAWDTSSLSGVAELTGSANPTTLTATLAGEGTLKATAGGLTASVPVKVTRATPPPPEPTDTNPSQGCGCGNGRDPGALAGLLSTFALACGLRGRRRRPI